MEVRHLPPRGVPVTVCVWGCPSWCGGKHPPRGCKKITGPSTGAQERLTTQITDCDYNYCVLTLDPAHYNDLQLFLGISDGLRSCNDD